jgi:hypothetical protein
MQPFFISKQCLFRFFGIYKGGNFPISIARYYNFWVADACVWADYLGSNCTKTFANCLQLSGARF